MIHFCVCVYVDDLMAWLKDFSLPLEVISASMDALFSLGQSDDIKDTMVTIHTALMFEKLPFSQAFQSMSVCLCLLKSFLNQFCGELVSVCEEYLSTILLNERGAENLNEDLLVRPDLTQTPKI